MVFSARLPLSRVARQDSAKVCAKVAFGASWLVSERSRSSTLLCSHESNSAEIQRTEPGPILIGRGNDLSNLGDRTLIRSYSVDRPIFSRRMTSLADSSELSTMLVMFSPSAVRLLNLRGQWHVIQCQVSWRKLSTLRQQPTVAQSCMTTIKKADISMA